MIVLGIMGIVAITSMMLMITSVATRVGSAYQTPVLIQYGSKLTATSIEQQSIPAQTATPVYEIVDYRCCDGNDCDTYSCSTIATGEDSCDNLIASHDTCTKMPSS